MCAETVLLDTDTWQPTNTSLREVVVVVERWIASLVGVFINREVLCNREVLAIQSKHSFVRPSHSSRPSRLSLSSRLRLIFSRSFVVCSLVSFVLLRVRRVRIRMFLSHICRNNSQLKRER